MWPDLATFHQFYKCDQIWRKFPNFAKFGFNFGKIERRDGGQNFFRVLLHKICRLSVTKLGNFFKTLGQKKSSKGIPNISWLSGQFWKTSLFKLKLLWLLFGQFLQKLGFFSFKHLVALVLVVDVDVVVDDFGSSQLRSFSRWRKVRRTVIPLKLLLYLSI